jgi:hypothetical protein
VQGLRREVDHRLRIELALMYDEDPKGRQWLDRHPDDPDQN